jgi:hypothetical protein
MCANSVLGGLHHEYFWPPRSHVLFAVALEIRIPVVKRGAQIVI